MVYTELVTLTNRRIDDIVNYIKRGGTLSYDPQLARLFKEWYGQNINGLGSSLTQKLGKNIDSFSDAKTEYMIRELLQNKADIDSMLEGYKDRYNNYSKVENGIVKGKVKQSKDFELWTSKKGSYLMYVTAQDDRVRESHKQLDGLVRPVSDRIWAEIAPRQAYGCRCTLKNIMKPDYVSESIPDIKDVSDRGIANNTFYTGEIFTKNHSYYG